MQELVETYIKLRDCKTELKKRWSEKNAKIDTAMEKIEAALLEEFQDRGIESARTEAGTAYKQTRTSATVADWNPLLDFIRANEAWDFLERRVSKDAVQTYIEEHGDLPPGVNVRQDIVVNVRRS